MNMLKFKFEAVGMQRITLDVTVNEKFELLSNSCSDFDVGKALNDPNNGLTWLANHVYEECSGTSGSNFVTLIIKKKRIEFKVTRINWFFVGLADNFRRLLLYWMFS